MLHKSIARRILYYYINLKIVKFILKLSAMESYLKVRESIGWTIFIFLILITDSIYNKIVKSINIENEIIDKLITIIAGTVYFILVPILLSGLIFKYLDKYCMRNIIKKDALVRKVLLILCFIIFTTTIILNYLSPLRDKVMEVFLVTFALVSLYSIRIPNK
jgi:hypothetical protein